LYQEDISLVTSSSPMMVYYFVVWIFQNGVKFSEASGQKLNSAKTAIFFNKNMGRAFKDHIQSVMRVAATKGYEKYLGLPALVGCSKLKAFANIQERV
jgi:hypothetical protein